jgi:hypothetical protein
MDSTGVLNSDLPALSIPQLPSSSTGPPADGQ